MVQGKKVPVIGLEGQKKKNMMTVDACLKKHVLRTKDRYINLCFFLLEGHEAKTIRRKQSSKMHMICHYLRQKKEVDVSTLECQLTRP